MRLSNYKRGYLFDCSIHGSIYCTPKEWEQVKDLVKSVIFNSSDLEKYITFGKARAYNIRVTATELVAKHFGLDKQTTGHRYKKGNYIFIVK